MRNQEDEMLKKCLRQTMEQIQPDEETKKRMYLEIMRRASAAENAKTAAQKKRPWYLRWQTSTGICTAALLCVVIAAASIHSKMPDGTNQLEVVPPAAVTTAVEPEERPDTETEPAATAETTLPETASDADAAVQSSANTETKTIAEEPGDIPEVIEEPADNTAPQTTGKHNTPAVTTAVPQTSKPAETTRAAETSKKADVVTTAAPVVTTLPETSKEQETETFPIRQNIYLYYKLIWRNNPYDTNYDEVPGGVLDNYLGYGVTQGSDVDDTYTVLIYSITGVDPRQQVAVQYVGEEKYYVFTIQ